MLSLPFFRPLIGQNSDSAFFKIKLYKDIYIKGDTVEISVINLTDDTLYMWYPASFCLFKENSNNIWVELNIVNLIKVSEKSCMSNFISHDTIHLKWNQKINVPDSHWQHVEPAIKGKYKFELRFWKSRTIDKSNRHDYYNEESEEFVIE